MEDSTDISNSRVICILIGFIGDTNNLTTQLLECLKFGADEYSFKWLFPLFNKSLETFNLIYRNIVWYRSQNASVMMGNKEFFKTYFLNNNIMLL